MEIGQPNIIAIYRVRIRTRLGRRHSQFHNSMHKGILFDLKCVLETYHIQEVRIIEFLHLLLFIFWYH